MIVVLADDLTGAAELAGAALHHGLRAEVQTTFSADTDADILCLDTNTRSLSAVDASRVTLEMARQVAAAKPDWIYKKCDSVLRGHVLAEIRAIQAATGHSQALLLSANPTRGRIVRDGEYFVHGQPLHQTAFANDPEHPRRSAKVKELLGGDLTGVLAPDAETTTDLGRHAASVDAKTLPAGGVEFFEALLRARSSQAPSPFAQRGERDGVRGVLQGTVGSTSCESLGLGMLFVCGSAAAWAKGREAQATAHGISVHSMPPTLFADAVDASAIEQWAGSLATELRNGRSVMAAIGQSQLLTSPAPAVLVQRLAQAVTQIIASAPVGRICAEGGATARAVAGALGWTRFAVRQQLAGGVVELQPLARDAPAFILKVGSYDWPGSVWPKGLESRGSQIG